MGLWSRVQFRLFWNTWDHLGAWLLCSAAAAALSLPVVTAPAAWGALLGCAAAADREQEIGLARFWECLRRFAVRSTLLGLASGLIVAVTWANLVFYSASGLMRQFSPLVRVSLAGLLGWLGVFALAAVQVGWAFLALQDLPVGKALRRGALVTAGHPLAVLAIGLEALAIGVVMAVSVLGAVALLGALWANLSMGVAAGAVEHYEEIEDRKLRARLEREGQSSWLELRALEQREAVRRRRHDRSWRDILRPWELP